MGDHRASIKIQFEMHDVKRETDMWINWWDDGTGVDSRIIEFFEEAAGAAMDKYYEQQRKWEAEQRKAKEEERDRQEFARLKAKYEKGAP